MFKTLVVFRLCYICISYRFGDIQHQIMARLEVGGKGRSRSLNTAPFDRSLCDLLLVCHRKYLYLVPFSSYLALRNVVTLKYRFLGVTNCHGHGMHSLKAWLRFHIRLP